MASWSCRELTWWEWTDSHGLRTQNRTVTLTGNSQNGFDLLLKYRWAWTGRRYLTRRRCEEEPPSSSSLGRPAPPLGCRPEATCKGWRSHRRGRSRSKKSEFHRQGDNESSFRGQDDPPGSCLSARVRASHWLQTDIILRLHCPSELEESFGMMCVQLQGNLV